MPAPYDYTLKGESPIMAGLRGYNIAQEQSARAMEIERQRQAMAEAERKRQRQQQYQQDIIKLTENPFSSAGDYVKLQATYPESIEAIKQVQQGRSKEQLQGDVEQVQKIGAAFAAGKNDIAINQIVNYRNALENSGRENEVQSIDNILEMAEENPGAVSAELNKYLLAQMGPEKFTDYFNNLQKMQIGGKAQPVGGGIIIEDPVTGQKKLVTGSFQGTPEGGKLTLAATELPGTILSRFGETPEEQQKREVKTTQEKAQATAAEKKRTEFYDQYETIQKNINTLDEGISIIEKGLAEGKDLGLGPIRRFFPAWGAAAQRLKNVTDRMGLDVVSSVTFGALSEGELKMALRTAKPPDLKGRELVQWMRDRKDAQEKLAAYLSEAANFIGSPKEGGGINTAADWMKYVENRKKGLEAQQKTTELRTQPVQNQGLKNLSTTDLFQRFQNTMRP